MSLPALTGTISQGAVVASAPSSVSIATSSSGNYNNAVVVLGKEHGDVSENGSNFSSNSVTVNTLFPLMKDGQIMFYGYLRATGATSYAWNLSGLTVNQWGGIPGGDPGINPILEGSNSTAQDVTDTNGAGIGRFVIVPVPPQANDQITVTIDATATNSGGSTAATQLTVICRFPAS